MKVGGAALARKLAGILHAMLREMRNGRTEHIATP